MLTDMPPGTIGFRVTGEVERKDYDDVLTPELRRAFETGEGLRTLYVVEHLDEIGISCRNRGLCHRSGSGGQSPPRASIARAIGASWE
jgi:hypothetical protein